MSPSALVWHCGYPQGARWLSLGRFGAQPRWIPSSSARAATLRSTWSRGATVP